MEIRKITPLLALIAALGMAGCNTVEGVGEDIEAVGESIEDAADD